MSAPLKGIGLVRHFQTEMGGRVGCWVWPGRPNKDGYARIMVKRRSVAVHRMLFAEAYGPIPADAVLCHRCDVRLCCNPAHMFVGSPRDNVHDCIAKGRFARGERAGGSKLTEHQVRHIRTDARTQMQIAAAFGISQSLVSAIRLRQRWAHVSD